MEQQLVGVKFICVRARGGSGTAAAASHGTAPSQYSTQPLAGQARGTSTHHFDHGPAIAHPVAIHQQVVGLDIKVHHLCLITVK